MPRFFSPISIDELKKKVEETFENDPGLIMEKLEKDLKVSFDFENFTMTKGGFRGSLAGYRTLSNGLTFLGIDAGGDWETPVFFIIYWDGKKLRAYIPTEGNTWNTDTKYAFGNNHVADKKNVIKRFPELKGAWPEIDNLKIQEDIESRIKLEPKAPRVTDTLEKRVKSLVYYGPGHEVSELFQSACSFAYQLSGMGDNDKAKLVVDWAEEMAEASKVDWVNDGNDINDLSNSMRGSWGY